MARAFRRLSAEEASRALYIDFEGRKDEAPVLLGVLRRAGGGDEPWVQQDIVDQAFAGLGGRAMSLHEAVSAVVVRAESRERRIVSWSEHDLEVVRSLSDRHPELVRRFEGRYANALRVARRWRARLYDGVRPEFGDLERYLEYIDYPVPPEAVAGNVGETIRRIRDRLDRGLDPTDDQRARWQRLLAHNRHDCAGMKRLCVTATRELDEAGIG